MTGALHPAHGRLAGTHARPALVALLSLAPPTSCRRTWPTGRLHPRSAVAAHAQQINMAAKSPTQRLGADEPSRPSEDYLSGLAEGVRRGLALAEAQRQPSPSARQAALAATDDRQQVPPPALAGHQAPTPDATQIPERPQQLGSVRGKGGSVSRRLQRGLRLSGGVGSQPVAPLDIAEHERLPAAGLQRAA